MTGVQVPPGETQELENHFLLIYWPYGRMDHYRIEKDVVRIGRHPDKNDVVVPRDFATVSGSHCEIRRTSDGYEVVDLDSSNGTFLNGQRIESPHSLKDRDDIRVGNSKAGHQVQIVMHLSKQIPTGLRRADTAQPAAAPPPPVPEQIPYLTTRWPSGEELVYELTPAQSLIGRDPTADLVVPQALPFVSNRHLTINHEAQGYTITDLGSTNGTRVNNQFLTPNQPFPLTSGDLIRIGDDRFGASIGLTFTDPNAEVAPVRGFTLAGEIQDLVAVRQISIGRDPTNDIVLETPSVSRHHAVVERRDGGHAIRDLGSANGTLVNGQRVEEAALRVNDLVQIGPHLLVYDGQTLSRFDSQGMRMDVVDVYKEVPTRKGRIRILDEISMTILPREFVALVGGSGAGKSTLMDALNGFRPASGQILLNANDFYNNYDSYRTQLGYVPQYDILHTALDVMTALGYAARLRLPPDVTPTERKQRIETVLQTVGMPVDRWKTRISDLSGGQRKRVSIAAELLAEPKLFFLDEPTSGLDPGLEKKMMYTMRQMADEGRTIILITHATGNIVQADHVAFLAQGRLVYFGPPQDARDYFDVDDFADIYEKSERHGEEWRDGFTERKPEHFERFVVERQQTRQMMPAGRAQAARPGIGQVIGQMIRQFTVLSQRMTSIIFSEKLTLGVLLAIMPLIAIFLVMVADGQVLVGDPDIVRDPERAAERLDESYLPVGDAQITLFAMSLAAVLFGLFASSNDLVNERSIYMRERMVNLKLPPYIFSKLFVYTFFAAFAVLTFLIVLAFKVRYPTSGAAVWGFLEFFVTLFLATMTSIALGLLLSSLAQSQNMVSYMILIVLFVQIIFSGAIFDLSDSVFQPISYLTVTRWTLVGLGTSNQMGDLGEAAVVCYDDVTVDQDSIVVEDFEIVEDSVGFDPSTGQPDLDDVELEDGSVEIDEDALEFVETGETACSNEPIEPQDMSVAYGESIVDLAGVWAILIFFGMAFTAATFIFVKRLDRT